MQGEITKHGVVHLLRKGVDHLGQHIDLCYPTATEGNATAADSFAANRFVITGQVHHSPSNRGEAVDLVAFVNGLPVFTFELKNNITKQTVDDAVQQYQRDRDPRELLFGFKRTIHPDLPGLYFIGLLQPVGAVMPLAEAQSNLVAEIITGEYVLPDGAELSRRMMRDHTRNANQFYASARHTMEVDFDHFLWDLLRERKRGRARARADRPTPDTPGVTS